MVRIVEEMWRTPAELSMGGGGAESWDYGATEQKREIGGR